MFSYVRNVVVFGGAIMGFVIGAGFASGQEILQFYTHLGFAGSVSAGLLSMLLLAVLFAVILEDGRKLQFADANDLFEYYCGKYLGEALKWIVAITMFLVSSIMVAGAGATVAQQYGADPMIGRLAMAAATVVTVLLGLRNLVNVIGVVAPLIAIFAIGVGISGIVSNPGGVTGSDEIVAGLGINAPFPTWWITGFMYAAYLIMGLVPFICGIGAQTKSRREAIGAGIFGSVGFMTGVLILGLGMLAHIQDVYHTEIPALALIGSDSPLVSGVFAIALLLAIYTTAVPMLWTGVNKLAPVDGTRRYVIVTIVLGVLALFGGLLKFSTMIGIVYPATGYVGIVIIVCMAWKKLWPASKTAPGRIG